MSDEQTRATADQERIDTRLLEVRVATINEESRSVEAVLSTDREVEMYDWRSGEMIREVLLADAVDVPRQVPLLAMHSRYDLDDVLGSVRDIRQEPSDGHSQLVGRLQFAEGDETAERAWQKVRQGHLTDVSVGYRVRAATEVQKGNSAVIAGREFRATDRRLRVATDWQLREASIVPIGADSAAKTRADIVQRGAKQMDEALRNYLESVGLRSEATNEEAWQHLAGLQGDELDQAKRVMFGDEEQRNEQPPADPPADKQRDDDVADPEAGRTEERQRVMEIRQLAGSDVPATVVDQAINDGWDVPRASQEFLTAVRGQRMRQSQQAPAGHGVDRGSQVNIRSLAAGMAISAGLEPIGLRMHNGRSVVRSEALTERDADYGDELARMSALDIVRECARLDTGRLHRDPTEAWRAAVSGTSLDRVFTTSMYAQLIAGWEETPDTTNWCQVEDVPNFMAQEDISLRANANLDRHPRGSTAKHASMEDDYETYKAYRFSKQFTADEQDIIDDRLGALMQMPREMGQAARRVRPDMVYSILLANGTLTATGGALFNSTAETTPGGHKNLGSTALGTAGLKAAITAMMAHRLNPSDEAVPLNIRPQWLLVPPDLEWTARELLTSGEIRGYSATNTVYPTVNVLRDAGLSIIVDSRIDATGTSDPVSGTAYTGSATNYFLAAGRRTVKVVYRRGTGRSPQMRSSMLTQGQWGVNWDINLDIGAAAVDYRGLYQGNS